MKPRKVGDMRHQVTLQSDGTPTESATGGLTPNWTAYATNVWAAIETISGLEFWRGMKVSATATHGFTLRHMSGVTDAVTPSMRISFDSRTFYIEQVRNEQERDWWVHIITREDVD